MSLVTYDSSDESGEEEVILDKNVDIKHTSITKSDDIKLSPKMKEVRCSVGNLQSKLRTRFNLPTPRNTEISDSSREVNDTDTESVKINFNLLPSPKRLNTQEIAVDDDDDDDDDNDFIHKNKKTNSSSQKIVKAKEPVKITVPSLSHFQDLDEEKKSSRCKVTRSQKGTGLFDVLPPPKSATTTISKSLIPHQIKESTPKSINCSPSVTNFKSNNKPLVTDQESSSRNNDSDSENDDNSPSTTDFFSLSTPDIPTSIIQLEKITVENRNSRKSYSLNQEASLSITSAELPASNKILVSNVMNLSKEEILNKNKVNVGPKLPIPEQEYEIDSAGNVVLDEKAIEYLCGKRGVKRKEKELEGIDIIEIDGEQIKPDEREWMVKALTEEPVVRPSVSLGVTGQSKRKHQITYLAQMAKANEVELKNKWAQNRMTRQQTQSKYGF